MDNAEALIRYTLREVVKVMLFSYTHCTCYIYVCYVTNNYLIICTIHLQRCADDLRFLDQNHDFINSSGAHAANATATTNTNSNKKNANNASNTSKEAAGPSLIDRCVLCMYDD